MCNFRIGQKVKCIKTDSFFSFGSIVPPLKLNNIYIVNKVKALGVPCDHKRKDYITGVFGGAYCQDCGKKIE